MTIEELRLAIPIATESLDAINNASNDIKDFLGSTADLIDESNPISATVTIDQLTLVVGIIQARKQALDGAIAALDLSNFI